MKNSVDCGASEPDALFSSTARDAARPAGRQDAKNSRVEEPSLSSLGSRRSASQHLQENGADFKVGISSNSDDNDDSDDDDDTMNCAKAQPARAPFAKLKELDHSQSDVFMRNFLKAARDGSARTGHVALDESIKVAPGAPATGLLSGSDHLRVDGVNNDHDSFDVSSSSRMDSWSESLSQDNSVEEGKIKNINSNSRPRTSHRTGGPGRGFATQSAAGRGCGQRSPRTRGQSRSQTTGENEKLESVRSRDKNLLGADNSAGGRNRLAERRSMGVGRGRGRGRGLLRMSSTRSFDELPDNILEQTSRRRGVKQSKFKRMPAGSSSRSLKKFGNMEANLTDPVARHRGERAKSMGFIRGGSFRNDEASMPSGSPLTNRMSVAFGASREQSHYHAKVIRKRRNTDLQTGGETLREVVCQRIIDYPLAMDPTERRRKVAFRTARESGHQSTMHLETDHDGPQYRLQSKIRASGYKEHLKSHAIQQSQTVNPGPLTTYLIWSLRSNVAIVLISEAFAFWALTCLFALFIYLGASYEPYCLRFSPDERDFEEAGSHFIDAYQLSWTTFSTVGYGLVHPQVQPVEDESVAFVKCAFMKLILSLESFVGVLFASFCGAVIVGKMTRAKSTAPVRYSQRMTIRFGSGVMLVNGDDDHCDEVEDTPVTKEERKQTRFPCPVLEFRVANSMFSDNDGEISNAKINVVASVRAKEGNRKARLNPTANVLSNMKESASLFLRTKVTNNLRSSGYSVTFPVAKTFSNHESALKDTTGDRKKGSNGSFLRRSFIANPASMEKGEEGERKGERNSVLRRVSVISQAAIESVVMKKKLIRRESHDKRDTVDKKELERPRQKAICVVEDSTGGKKLFSSLKLQCETHPFFKRIWTLRHELNAESPILSAEACRMVRDFRGKWPREACTAEFIREHVQFQQLIVSMSGTKGSSNVYGLSVYDYRNLHIGYRFSNILDAMPDGRLGIDLDGMDTIHVQRGGGEEAIDYYEANLHKQDFEDQSSEFHDMSGSCCSSFEEICEGESLEKLNAVCPESESSTSSQDK